MIRPAHALLVTLFATPLAGAAQDQHLNLFLYEKSYAGIGTPNVIGMPAYYAAVAEPDLLAEAQFVAHVSLHRGLNAQELREGRGGSGFNWFLTPQFRLRALDVPSGPIRSLSFMPKFTIQWLKSTGGQSNPLAGSRTVYGINVVIGHHSNGGESCGFVDEDSANDCMSSLSPIPSPAAREFQVKGGNFSTNYLELGGGIRWGEVTDDPTQHWPWAVDLALSAQFHHNVGFPLPGGAKPAFADLYGKTRVRLDVGGHKLLGKAVALRGWVRIDAFNPREERFPGARNFTLESELFLQRIEGAGDLPRWVRRIPTFVGVGIRYVRGQDFYNTQFVRDISNLQILLIVDPWSPSAR